MPLPPRLLVIVNVFRPDLGGGILFSDLMEGLAERGVDITVRCAYPYYPEWRDKSGNNGLRIQKYVENGVTVERLGIYIPSNPNSLLQRVVYEASFFLSLLRTIGRGRRYDLVMAYCPLVGGVAFGAVQRLLYRQPLWLNVQDLSAAAAAAGGIVRPGPAARLMQRVQGLLFNTADVWSTLTTEMQEELSRLSTNDRPILVIPNWMHRSLENAITSNPKPATHRPSHPVRLLYSGNLGTKQNLLEFCQRLSESDADFVFNIRAAGSRLDELIDWMRAAGDDRFHVADLTDEETFARSLADADLFVITEKSGSGGSFVPSKLVPATVSGTPVLALSDADSPLGKEVLEHRVGPHFSWVRVESAVDLVRTLPDRNDEYAGWRAAARARAPHYDRTTVIDRYYETIVDLAGSSL